MGKWRAAVLIGVHLLVLAHVTHYLIAGETLSPVEPSEAMYTLELGRVNAGFIFFILAIVSTLIFGRFFCGWGCHLIALQDACAWLLRKAGIRPRPLRSRLLLLAPATLAFYMFVWPSLARLVSPEAPRFPGFTSHIVTSEFWRTFPGPVFAVLTLLACGFVAVVVLGSKGFCTYGCPYGTLFHLADKLSPMRVVVNDKCQQTGHCTSNCTSNVVVHAEVAKFGMVVDSGCMKCMDCVSGCPNDALSVSFAKPALFAGRAQGWTKPHASIPLGEELALLAVCLVATLAFRGLYDGPPLLMAIGLGGITAVVALKLWHLARSATVRFSFLTLKAGGELSRSGLVFLPLAILWCAFTAHSAFVQWHRMLGRQQLEHTEASREAALSGSFDRAAASPAHQRAGAAAARHFELADRFGLAPVSELDLGLAWIHLLRNEPAEAEARIRASLALDTRDPIRHENLVEFLLARRRADEAAAALLVKMQQAERTPSDSFRLGRLLVALGRLEEALPQFASAAQAAPENPAAVFAMGGVERQLGRPARAVPHLELATRLVPDDPGAHAELGLARAEAGDLAGSADALRRALELAPNNAEIMGLLRDVEARAAAQP